MRIVLNHGGGITVDQPGDPGQRVQSRSEVLADTSQARPAIDATKTDTGPKARRGGKTPAKQVQRNGLTR